MDLTWEWCQLHGVTSLAEDSPTLACGCVFRPISATNHEGTDA